VLVNLAVNARDAMPDGGTFTIAIDTVPVTDSGSDATSAPITPGPHVRVAVTDTGAGMDPGTRTRLFEPFFSTKGPGRGTGLGLAIVDGIVAQLGGHISVRSAPQRGTTFELYFPLSGAAALPRVAQPRAAVEVGRETILLVDDDPGIVILESAALTRHGYRVIAAASPDAALALVRARSEPIDLILSDIVMPGMSGPMLVQRLRESASTPVIYMSGYERTASLECQPDDGAEFLRKPFKQSDLLACVRRALDGVPPAGAALN
jgi:CheY-like chemotaxis protein